MSKILFLDIDGVLNSIKWYKKRTHPKNGGFELDPEAMALFDQIVEETDCKVVLSSTWRLSRYWKERLEAQGLNTNSIIDRTERLPRPVNTGIEYCERGKEVKAWLEKHPEVKVYAILDDDADFLPEQPLFKTTWEEGLTKEITSKVIEHLI